jgi:hypothetical protein
LLTSARQRAIAIVLYVLARLRHVGVRPLEQLAVHDQAGLNCAVLGDAREILPGRAGAAGSDVELVAHDGEPAFIGWARPVGMQRP